MTVLAAAHITSATRSGRIVQASGSCACEGAAEARMHARMLASSHTPAGLAPVGCYGAQPQYRCRECAGPRDSLIVCGERTVWPVRVELLSKLRC